VKARIGPVSLEGRGIGQRVRVALAALNLAKTFTLSPALPPQGEGGKAAPLLSAEELAALAMQATHLAQASLRREVHDHHAGDWPSAWMGRGLDYEESRPYSPGDDLRDMDWRTTARLTHPFVKIYREERQPLLHLVVDRGASMRFGTRRRLKVAQAARIAALMAFDAAARNTAISATLWDIQDRELPPRHDRASVLALIEAIAAPCPPLPPGVATETLHEADRLTRLAAEQARGTRLVLISDFAWLAEEHQGLLGRLADRFNVLAVRVADPAELALPDVGLTRFQDLTDGQIRWLDTARAAEREAFAAECEARRTKVRKLLARSGIPSLELGSEEDDLLPVLMSHA
jgi:uncharacterized protein (DUF58 family)